MLHAEQQIHVQQKTLCQKESMLNESNVTPLGKHTPNEDVFEDWKLGIISQMSISVKDALNIIEGLINPDLHESCQI